ncbi:uncharacterized protein EAE97_004604 [Botrytis byssoidea]|uniref:Uncharacterized protein n=1 Tax=Botrytis byssoidea TaxID=139641 RepID=A0A9P5IQB4_9HELO|nr:uncharacterized protein EAE97_004604 [Botrytis byssoidea]KAF7947355.1 hypothetical protein EAE97_004604 [Botrytis byssoidea]
MPIETVEPEAEPILAEDNEGSAPKLPTPSRPAITPQVVILHMTLLPLDVKPMDATTGAMELGEYTGEMTGKRSREQDNGSDSQDAKRLRATLPIMTDLALDQQFFTH